MAQTATETTGNGDKIKRTWSVHTNEAYTGICFACEFDGVFSGFNTARKAAWLKLTQLECASDRKDSQMLLLSIRDKLTIH